MKIKIVGCGLSGITAALSLKKKGHDVIIFEKRNHIGGNCYDSLLNGVLVHNYGPHIFHTDDDEVFSFLSEYTDWTSFSLQPKGNTELGIISLPYSRKTVSEIGRELTQEEIKQYIFRDYSEKQWGVPFDSIPSSITNRIPKTKDCDNPTWFEGQKHQCIPKHGYTKMFESMLFDIPLILGCDEEIWRKCKADLTIYTGPLDAFYNYKIGRLPYRSLEFKHLITPNRMPHFMENQNTKAVAYTRKYDHSYFSSVKTELTVITEEYPKECEDGDIPYYPIPFGSGLSILNAYKALARKESNVIFMGRLANYAYLDMWMAVRMALNKIKTI